LEINKGCTTMHGRPIFKIYPTRCNFTRFIYIWKLLTCFGWYLHLSSGARRTVSTEPGICYTVAGSSNSSTIAAGSSKSVTNTRCCRYSCMRSWWWVEVPPETCEQFPDINKPCKVASCWIYIGIYLLVLPSCRIYIGIYLLVLPSCWIYIGIYLLVLLSCWIYIGIYLFVLPSCWIYIGIYLLVLLSCWVYWNLFTRFTILLDILEFIYSFYHLVAYIYILEFIYLFHLFCDCLIFLRAVGSGTKRRLNKMQQRTALRVLCGSVCSAIYGMKTKPDGVANVT
jgi:hypothetical protein